MPAAYEGDHEFEQWVAQLPENLQHAARRAAAERVAQGLPPRLEDPGTGARLARILDAPTGTPDVEVAS